MPHLSQPPAKGRHLALAVLVVGLAATAFGVWREREIARQNLVIRWQDGFTQLQPILLPALSQRFETLHDQAKSALRHDHFSEMAWRNFLEISEWHSRFHGLKEIGYAEFSEDKCVVKFCDSILPTPHTPGFDLDGDTALRESVNKAADAGYGGPTKNVTMMLGTNRVVIVLMNIPAVDKRPGTAAENRTNLRGFVFFALDQPEYFSTIASQLENLPFNIRLLAPDEASPPKTPTQRPFGNGGISGEWHFFGTLKSPATASATQWIVGGGGIALSLLLCFLFASQARLRLATETANEKILERDAEITTLNRDLEEKITARTAELKVALAEEKELNRLKSNFISMVTHEIRTPLALILGSSEILSRYLDRLAPEKRAEHLRTIDAAVQRMSALLEDVLLFSKAEAGRMEFNPVAMDLKNFCTQLLDEIASATNRRCPVELNLAGVSEAARGDENLLRHIFANLLANAIKYSPPGAAVNFSVSRAGGDAVFIVQDHGMGIPEADRKRLFTPFYRGKNVATIQGTGLGLVIVKHCIEQQGGSIEVESAENVGTTVRVRLPLFSPAHTEFVKRISQTQNP